MAPPRSLSGEVEITTAKTATTTATTKTTKNMKRRNTQYRLETAVYIAYVMYCVKVAEHSFGARSC